MMSMWYQQIRLLTVLVAVGSAGHACAQRIADFDPSNPDHYKSFHRVGVDVVPPPADQVQVIGNHGDTMVMGWAQRIPSDKHVQDTLFIYYRYTLGEEKARVIFRGLSWLHNTPIGPAGIASSPRGDVFYDGIYTPNHEAAYKAFREAMGHRRWMGQPRALSHGLLYQAMPEKSQDSLGAIYYIPRNGRTYLFEKELKISDAGFGKLNSKYANKHVQFNSRFVVIINQEGSEASSFDIKTGRLKTFKLIPPEGSEQWPVDDPLLGSRYLFAAHGLYNPATGERVQVRRQKPEYIYIDTLYRDDRVMHEGVIYAIRESPKNKFEPSLVCFPALGKPGQIRTIKEMSGSKLEHFNRYPSFVAGHNGLIYADGKRWAKTDWLNVTDFEKID